MLMVTTTVGMLNRVHSHTSNLWPAVPLDSVFMISPTSFQHWFIAPTTSGNAADDGTFWAASDGEDVTDGELGFFTAVDELAGMDTFWADNSLNSLPVFVWVVEDNLG